jgi:hypothetical protein
VYSKRGIRECASLEWRANSSDATQSSMLPHHPDPTPGYWTVSGVELGVAETAMSAQPGSKIHRIKRRRQSWAHKVRMLNRFFGIGAEPPQSIFSPRGTFRLVGVPRLGKDVVHIAGKEGRASEASDKTFAARRSPEGREVGEMRVRAWGKS